MSDQTTQTTQSAQSHFAPTPAFAADAVGTQALYDRAAEDRLGFWEDQAARLRWSKPWTQTLDWSDAPFAKWFVGGELNVADNCLDRHVEAGNGDRVAYYWEGEPGDSRTITYAELLDEVKRAANALTELGVGKGDRVAIYLPMILELPITMLACSRIGAAHSVVFAGFSANSLRDRINDATCKVLVTADGGWRRGSVVDLKGVADEAVAETPCIEHVVMVTRTQTDVAFDASRDHHWDELMQRQSLDCPAEPMDSEQLLYLLYTSGTTGKPKGIMHTTGGYMVNAAATHSYVFDLRPETDVYWCAADIGWVTGHTYIAYGPLANGCTSVMYEGTPDHPHTGRFWEIVEKYGVTQLYTAPTAIRAFMKWGADVPATYDLSSLRVLGTVGEPINPEAWRWYRNNIGPVEAPIVDTWWQTETGGHMMSPLPGVTSTVPGSANGALPGISVAILDEKGEEITGEGEGLLVLTEPWPSMLRGIWGDEERYRETYWAKFGDKYFAGDGAKRDADGNIWVLGRVDDVMNISGHRLSTSEIESSLVAHPSVVEAAVVGKSDEMTGQAIAAFVVLADGFSDSEELRQQLRTHVADDISPIAKPKEIHFVPDVPKTRSGKIMRRLLRDVAEGRALGDTTTLANEAAVQAAMKTE
jgi:acetyl-CoA synthetase